MTNKIFDTSYVSEESTVGDKPVSSINNFLKSPISEEQIKRYGTSKPRRVVIKAKISGR